MEYDENEIVETVAGAVEDSSVQTAGPVVAESKPCKIFKTIFMMSIWIFVGLSMSVIGPSVDDLRRQVSCDYEEFTYALVGRSVGTVVGAVSLGIANERFKGYTDLFIGAELFLGGATLAAVPWAENLLSLTAYLSCVGFACGGLSASGNSHVVYMWGEKAAAPIHLVHFGFGLGTVVGPLLTGPFISKNTTASSSHSLFELPTHSLENYYAYDSKRTPFGGLFVEDASQNLTDSRIYIPFGTCGGIAVTSALGFFVLFFLSTNKALYNRISTQRRTTNIKFKEMLNPGSCAGGKSVYGIQMFSLLLLLYILIVSKDTLVNTFLYVIAVDTSLAFPAWQGVMVTTIYWVAYAVARLVFAFIGHYVRIQIMIFFEMALVLMSQVALVVWGSNSQLAFRLTTAAFGFTAGPVYPSGMAFVDRYLHMTPVAFSVLDIGIGTGALISNWLTGYIYQHESARDLFYVSLGCGIGITLILIIMQILGTIQGDRYDRVRRELNSGNVQDTDPLIST